MFELFRLREAHDAAPDLPRAGWMTQASIAAEMGTEDLLFWVQDGQIYDNI